MSTNKTLTGKDQNNETTKTTKREYSGNLNLRIPKTLHKELVEQAAANGVSLNQYALFKLSK